MNAEGERQAEALAGALAGEAIDVVVASDLQRAHQTAQALARRLGLPIETHAGLRERCYGGFEGLLYAEIEARYPAEFAAWQAREVDAVMPPGERHGESFRQFYQRCVDTLATIAAHHRGRCVAVVAHGGVLECAHRAARALDLATPRDFSIKNASINRFRYRDGKLELTSWGEVGHLQPRALDEQA